MVSVCFLSETEANDFETRKYNYVKERVVNKSRDKEITTTRCVITQKSAALSYFAAEA
jgi:hypothetical protein